jgi:hypothetical protein
VGSLWAGRSQARPAPVAAYRDGPVPLATTGTADVIDVMRLVSLVGTLMLTWIFAVAPAGGTLPSQRRTPSCPQAHAHPVRADSQVVIYTIPEALEGLYETEHFIATRVRAYGHKGSFKIAESRIPEPTEGWGDDVFHLTLDGTMIAYERDGRRPLATTRKASPLPIRGR